MISKSHIEKINTYLRSYPATHCEKSLFQTLKPCILSKISFLYTLLVCARRRRRMAKCFILALLRMYTERERGRINLKHGFYWEVHMLIGWLCDFLWAVRCFMLFNWIHGEPKTMSSACCFFPWLSLQARRRHNCLYLEIFLFRHHRHCWSHLISLCAQKERKQASFNVH